MDVPQSLAETVEVVRFAKRERVQQLTKRLLGCSRRVARLEWRSGAKRHEPGRRRSGSVGTTPLDDADDLQGSSSAHRVFLAADSESLEAWKQLTESLLGDTTERITAKVLDDETKIGTFLLSLPESQLKTICCCDTADSDGRWRREQIDTKHGRRGSERWWQNGQSNTASMSKMRKHGSLQQTALTSTRCAENLESRSCGRTRVNLLEQGS